MFHLLHSTRFLGSAGRRVEGLQVSLLLSVGYLVTWLGWVAARQCLWSITWCYCFDSSSCWYTHGNFKFRAKFLSDILWLVIWNIFFHILGMSSSQLTFIFSRGVENTNQFLLPTFHGGSVAKLLCSGPCGEGITLASEWSLKCYAGDGLRSIKVFGLVSPMKLENSREMMHIYPQKSNAWCILKNCYNSVSITFLPWSIPRVSA